MVLPNDASLLTHFASLEDPRDERGKEHLLLDIITIAICAVISGAEGWPDIEEYGRAKVTWLQTFLSLPNGIPTHDTYPSGSKLVLACLPDWSQSRCSNVSSSGLGRLAS
jgi:hypothetical protein